MVNLKVQKLIFCKFKGLFELEGQGQGYQFLKLFETFRRSIYITSLKLNFLMVQKLLHSQGIVQNFKFKSQFYLEGQGQGHQLSNTLLTSFDIVM